MARRPEDTKGTLIFQEGKKIEGDYYIIAVYDDPSSCTISFSAYELENDCTYTYPLTYSEFDGLFKYDSELMNPSNQDGRFHWVIQRLDFVQDNYGSKVLCLAQEPTPEEEDDDDLVGDQKKEQNTGIEGQMGGKIDAATRVKLLKELDTHDDHKLHVQLVKSEDARKRFISKLQSQRLLQIEKASQRLLRADEQREARLIKLDIIKQQQAEKARELKEKEAANKSTVAQLELLMKQKEAQAIRRLIQEKDEQDRGMGREKDAARQRRKMNERKANEVAAIEAERAKQLARKRADQVVKEEQKIAKKNREIAAKVKELDEVERAVQVRRREEKDQIIADLWEHKAAVIKELTDKREKFEALEVMRDKINLDRDRARAFKQLEEWKEMRVRESAEAEETKNRRDNERREYLLQWQIDAGHRALAKREIQRRNAAREKKISERNEMRLRKFREEQFLETAQKRAMSPDRLGNEQGDSGMGDANEIADMMGASKEEIEAFQRTYEQQERVRRQAERLERNRQEDAKAKKMEALVGPDPNSREMQRVMAWRKEEEALKQKLVDARTNKEMATEKKAKALAQAASDRQELWSRLEEKRREASRERERRRTEAVVQRVKTNLNGSGLPRVLLF